MEALSLDGQETVPSYASQRLDATPAPSRRTRRPRGPSITVDARFDEHPKFALLAERLGIDRLYASAHVVKLWRWAARPENRSTDGVLRNQSPRRIEVIAEWRGQSGELFDALTDPEIGLLDPVLDGEFEALEWRIHDYEEWQRQSSVGAYKRARESEARKLAPASEPIENRSVTDLRSVTAQEEVVDVVAVQSAAESDGTPAALNPDPEKRRSEGREDPPLPPRKRGEVLDFKERPERRRWGGPARASPEVIDGCLEEWNGGAGTSGIQHAEARESCTSQRDRKIANLARHYGTKAFGQAARGLAASGWHCGKVAINGEKRKPVDLDWVTADRGRFEQWVRAGRALVPKLAVVRTTSEARSKPAAVDPAERLAQLQYLKRWRPKAFTPELEQELQHLSFEKRAHA